MFVFNSPCKYGDTISRDGVNVIFIMHSMFQTVFKLEYILSVECVSSITWFVRYLFNSRFSQTSVRHSGTCPVK